MDKFLMMLQTIQIECGLTIEKEGEKTMKLRDYIGQYGDIVAYSGHGGIIRSYDDDFVHYLDRPVVGYWIDPVNCRAFIQIG